MADKKFTNFNPNVNMPGGIGPVNKDIPLIESHYILVEDKASTDLTARLDKKLESIDEAITAINGDGTSGGLSDKVDKSSITTTAPATTNTDAQVPSTKSVATALATKPTGTLTTSVAASGTAADTNIPTEKAVRDAIDSKTITVDSALNTTSTNAIQNKVVKEALDTKQDTLTFDSAPTASSTNPVTSGGVKTALDAKQDALTFDSTPTASSNKPVTSGGIKTALDAKQDTLTFDTTPTAGSAKPVTSGGVKTALDTKQDTLTFDTTPTAGSSKPVTSGGVKTALDTKQNTLTFESAPVTGSVNPVTSTGIKNAITSAANANLGAMQAQYDEFVADAQDVLDTAATLSNGMVACADISAETTPGDTRLLIYTGTTNSTYTNGHWYYNSAAAGVAPVWTDGGAVGTAPTVDNTLSTPGAAADAKSVGDAIDDIVTISSTEPDGTGNKIWIKDTTVNEVQVPTFEEHIAKANKADISINNENDLTSASKAYAIGDHFYINDTNINSQTYGASTLYKATAAIAAGDPITVGTNCIAVQLATEVTELSNDIVESISDLKDDLDVYMSAFELNYTDSGLWEIGGISSSAGTDSTNTTRLRTAVLPWSVYAVSCNNGYKFMIFCYEGTTYKGTWNGSIVQKSATWHTSPVNLNDIGNYNFRFVFAKSDDSTIATADAVNCVFSGYVDKTLSHKGKPADAFATNEAIQKAENKIIEPEKTYISVDAETASNATLKSGFYCTRATASKMEIKTNASYNTFYLKLLNDAEFYCESGTSIFRICTIKQGIESESGETISITGSDCTEYNSGSFPDSTNKISLAKGDYIAVSATTSNNLSIMMSFDRFSDTIILTNRQIEQAKNATISAIGTSVKSLFCLYNSGTLMVYIPTGNGYVRYDFKHDVDQSINADIWRVDNAYHTDDNFSNASRLTTSGEWECALHLFGRDDFSGGIAHGDEIMQKITFIVDGSAVDVSDISEMLSFSILRIVETSILYDPADHTTQICVHGSEHVFTKDGLVINQNIIWSGTFETTTCYLAMFPPKKNGDDAVYMDTNYDVTALPTSNYRNVYLGAKSVGIFSETAKFCGTFEVPKYVDESGGNVLWILDNGGSNYHKMYFVVTTGKTVSNGEMWRTQTKYKLDVGE